MKNQSERYELSEKDLVPSLWRAYVRTDEYRLEKRIHSINSTHPLVRSAEEQGLTQLIHTFLGELETLPDLRAAFESRSEADWIEEWKKMHNTLFKYVYKKRGYLRPKGHNVRFGDPGDEDLYRIPDGGAPTYQGAYAIGSYIREVLPVIKADDLSHVCEFLARVHYEFIRVHPFTDGNGRIARTLTDRLAIALGYIPVIAGFPRNNKQKKEAYHKAIRGCIANPDCYPLTEWIRSQIEDKLAQIA